MGEIDLANFISHLVIYMVVLLLAISVHEVFRRTRLDVV